MSEAAIASALEVDPEDVFRTQVLCQWVTALDSAIPAGVWESLADDTADRGTGVVFALDVAPDHSSAPVAVTWTRPDGAAQVTLTDQHPGVEWVAARAVHLQQSWGGRLVVEQTGTAAFLLPQLGDVEAVPRRFFLDACSALDAAVSARQVRHGNQPELNAAAITARWATPGNGSSVGRTQGSRRWSPRRWRCTACRCPSPAPAAGSWRSSPVDSVVPYRAKGLREQPMPDTLAA